MFFQDLGKATKIRVTGVGYVVFRVWETRMSFEQKSQETLEFLFVFLKYPRNYVSIIIIMVKISILIVRLSQ